MDWSKSGYLALSALNVKDGYIDYSADAHYANQKLYDKWMSGNNLVKGQVLFTTEAPMGNVAQVPDNKGYVLSQRTIAFVTNKDKITDDFLASILRTPQSFKRLSALSSGGTAKGVSQKSLSSFKLVIPPSLKEQEKIGKLFRSFEHTIYLHEEKQKQLEQLKKALLQKMFADKSGYPKIRFKGFSEPWEQVKSKELFKNISDKNHSDLPVLSATQQNGMVYRDNLAIDIKYDQKSLANYKKVSPTDFVISLRSFQGGFEMSDKEGIVSPAYTVFNFKNRTNQSPIFWKYLFKRYNFIESLKKVTFGIRDGKAISFGQFGDTKPTYPSLKEQEEIGKFFEKLDRTITLHDQKIEDLKQLKQALLQQMFI